MLMMRVPGRWADDIRTSRRGRCDVRVNPVGVRSDFRFDLGHLDHVLPLDDFAFDMFAQLFRGATGRFDAQTRHALFHVRQLQQAIDFAVPARGDFLGQGLGAVNGVPTDGFIARDGSAMVGISGRALDRLALDTAIPRKRFVFNCGIATGKLGSTN